MGVEMEALEQAGAGDHPVALETRSEPGNRLHTAGAVPLVISVLLLVAGCMVFRRYWLEWPSEPPCEPDWGQCPIPWLGPLMAPLGLIGCIVGTGAEALRGRIRFRWLAAEVALVAFMVATLLFDRWLGGAR